MTDKLSKIFKRWRKQEKKAPKCAYCGLRMVPHWTCRVPCKTFGKEGPRAYALGCDDKKPSKRATAMTKAFQKAATNEANRHLKAGRPIYGKPEGEDKCRVVTRDEVIRKLCRGLEEVGVPSELLTPIRDWTKKHGR
jgi:hypothetical protein